MGKQSDSTPNYPEGISPNEFSREIDDVLDRKEEVKLSLNDDRTQIVALHQHDTRSLIIRTINGPTVSLHLRDGETDFSKQTPFGGFERVEGPIQMSFRDALRQLKKKETDQA